MPKQISGPRQIGKPNLFYEPSFSICIPSRGYCWDRPVWYENLFGVVIRPDKFKHKHRWSG